MRPSPIRPDHMAAKGRLTRAGAASRKPDHGARAGGDRQVAQHVLAAELHSNRPGTGRQAQSKHDLARDWTAHGIGPDEERTTLTEPVLVVLADRNELELQRTGRPIEHA